MTDHTTHHDDCGCLTAMYEEKVGVRDAEIAALRNEVERLRGALRGIEGTPCDENVHAACCGRRHREIARRVLGKRGTK